MKVRVLGCSGAIARGCRTTSFLIDNNLLVDAGTGVGDLTVDEMLGIEDVLLTHSHLDHIAALPMMVDASGSRRTKPLRIHALQATIDALKAHIFNNVIWPDFTHLPTPEAPFITFEALKPGEQLCVAGKPVEVLPAIHTVPAVGYAVGAESGYWVFTGDTEQNPALWARINQLRVSMLVIETAFGNRDSELAKRSKHLSPRTLCSELDLIDKNKRFPIYVMHTKPAEADTIKAEVEQLDLGSSFRQVGANDIRWLAAGQQFDF